jgi:hypothetical protein
VEDVVGTLANGEEEERYLLEENPDLTQDHMDACLIYAAGHGYYEKRRCVHARPGEQQANGSSFMKLYNEALNKATD